MVEDTVAVAKMVTPMGMNVSTHTAGFCDEVPAVSNHMVLVESYMSKGVVDAFGMLCLQS